MVSLGVPKKQNRIEADVHAMIVQDAKMRLGCADKEASHQVGDQAAKPSDR